ncbi:MAG: uridine kinase [Candidatus Nanohaloarchaeota archaeon QJJ-9]|nr:uridine kinase [Candidatus Nanohaloarchaeota archaeon QJJ-9]
MILVGLGGGSGSGKSYLASKIKERLPDQTLILPLDSYYKPFSDKPKFERMQINFDDPETFDWALLKEHLDKLKRGESIKKPDYSYSEFTRVGYEEVEPHEIIVLEGLYALYNLEIVDRMDLKIFLDPADDVRAVRRVRRDVKKRDRDVEFAVRQYLEKTRGMHSKEVDPTRENADFVFDDEEKNRFVEVVEKLFHKKEAKTTPKIKAFVEEKMEKAEV